MGIYDGMLPKELKKGKIGYYPVTNKEEWNELPDLYKVMEWNAVPDPFQNGKPSAVKAVIFDVNYLEPYEMQAKVSVHPQEVQKILFCSYKNPECHLYSVSGVELEDGSKLPAKWLQDTVTGAFSIVACGKTVGVQGGFEGYIPEHVQRLENGDFKFDFLYGIGKTAHYTLLNPFEKESVKEKEKDTVEKLMDVVAEYGLEFGWNDSDIIDTLVGCGVTKEDFMKYGKEDFVKGYFEEEASIKVVEEIHEGYGYRCKCCGELFLADMDNSEWFDEYGEAELWGHLQMEHEYMFEECQDWDTPAMLEEYFEKVGIRNIYKQGVEKEKEEIIKNAKVQALKGGFDQFVIKDGDGKYSFTRVADGKPVTLLFDNEKIIGKVTVGYQNGKRVASYEEKKSLDERIAGTVGRVSSRQGNTSNVKKSNKELVER